jgi:hypothetical protein
LEITYEKGLQRRDVAIQSSGGFFANTLKFPLVVPPEFSNVRFSDQFHWTTEIPERGAFLYGLSNQTGKPLRLYIHWDTGQEDFVELAVGRRLAVRGPNSYGSAIRYYMQPEVGAEEQTGAVGFVPANDPKGRYIFQLTPSGEMDVGISNHK